MAAFHHDGRGRNLTKLTFVPILPIDSDQQGTFQPRSVNKRSRSSLAPFDRFPAEVIHRIISCTADFVGVESNEVFQKQPRIILDVITSNPITAMPKIQHLLRNINDNDVALGAIILSSEWTATETYHLVYIAARLQRLACICLDTMQKNFVSAVADTRGSAAATKAAKSFSWVEEYRVYWALWNLQQYSTLRKTAQGRWGWSKASIQERADTYILWNNIMTLLPEQIWMRDGCEKESVKIASAFPAETPIPFFTSLDPPPHHQFPIWSPPDTPKEDSWVNEAWDRKLRHRLRETTPAAMIRCHASMTRNRRGFEQSSRDLQYAPPFRRLGVTIWDTWRIFFAGLLDNMFRKMEIPIPTPEGDTISGENSEFDLSLWDISARWLALVGKPPPDPSIQDLYLQ
ncbi:hypothetical protein BJX96DRAFT_166525 [Aspergillus floccosus]